MFKSTKTLVLERPIKKIKLFALPSTTRLFISLLFSLSLFSLAPLSSSVPWIDDECRQVGVGGDLVTVGRDRGRGGACDSGQLDLSMWHASERGKLGKREV
jgi:hypothetical protein